jgi:hypothetical protein
VNAPAFLTGKHFKRGLLWATIDPAAKFTGSEVAETRLGGYLKLFTSEEAARAALLAAGAANIEAEQRKRRGQR